MKARIQSLERLKNNPYGKFNDTDDFQLQRHSWQALNKLLYGRISEITQINVYDIDYSLNERPLPRYFIVKEAIEEFL